MYKKTRNLLHSKCSIAGIPKYPTVQKAYKYHGSAPAKKTCYSISVIDGLLQAVGPMVKDVRLILGFSFQRGSVWTNMPCKVNGFNIPIVSCCYSCSYLMGKYPGPRMEQRLLLASLRAVDHISVLGP